MQLFSRIDAISLRRLMNYRRKPIIIKLAEYLKNKNDNAISSRNTFERICKNSKEVEKKKQSYKNSDNLFMTSDPDEEMRNDFKWLINFDLKPIMGFDMDKMEDYRRLKERKRYFPIESCANHNKLSLTGKDILRVLKFYR